MVSVRSPNVHRSSPRRRLAGAVLNVFAFAILLFSAFPTRGQELRSPSGTATIHVLSDLIQVPVLALMAPFRSAPGLEAQDFVVRLDGGPPFHPRHVRAEGAEPLTLSLVIDTDTREARFLSQGLLAATQNWTPALFSESDRLSIFLYGCRLTEPFQNQSVDLNRQRDAITRALSLSSLQNPGAGERSCPRLAFDQVLEPVINRFASTTGWKVIILLQDAEHKADKNSLGRVQALAAAQGVTLFAIKYLEQDIFPASVYSENEGLNLLVSSLGGTSLHSSFQDLGEVMDATIGRIRKRYILSFPRSGNGTPGRHLLEVTTKARGVHIISSAVAAPPFDVVSCKTSPDLWFCSEQRPQYGPEPRKKLP